MLDFKEWMVLNEMPHAEEGNWSGEEMGYLNKIVTQDWLDSKFKLLGSISDIDLYIKKEKEDMCIGVDKNKLEIILQLRLGYLDITNTIEAKQTNMVKIDPKYEDRKIAKELYLLLINSGYVLVSDYTQYDGARRLWKSLGRSEKLYAYTYNQITSEITPYDHFDDKDDELWSFGNSLSKKFLLLMISHIEIR